MSLGLLMIVAALLLTGYNIRNEKQAGVKSSEAIEEVYTEIEVLTEEEVEENIQLHENYPEMSMPTQYVDGQYYIGTLKIPALGFELPIIDGWDDEKSKIAPCRYVGSVYQNDLVIAGHNYKTHFGSLKNLVAGDVVQFTDMDGHCFQYEVIEMEVLDGTAIEEMITGDWDLTLFTCTYGGRTRMTIRCGLLP